MREDVDVSGLDSMSEAELEARLQDPSGWPQARVMEGHRRLAEFRIERFNSQLALMERSTAAAECAADAAKRSAEAAEKSARHAGWAAAAGAVAALAGLLSAGAACWGLVSGAATVCGG